MNVLGLLQTGLYLIMNALLYPVILLLVFFVLWILSISGTFCSEFVLRRKDNTNMDEDNELLAYKISDDLLKDRYSSASGHIKKHLESFRCRSRLMRDFTEDLARQIQKGRDLLEIRVEKMLSTYEMEVAARLDNTRLMVRVGPMLGLMGTLIPMGPALLALTSGDLKQMADCLIIAFGTTVAGLAVGAVAFAISLVRNRWYARDLKDMEYMVDLLLEQLEKGGLPDEQTLDEKAAVVPMARG